MTHPIEISDFSCSICRWGKSCPSWFGKGRNGSPDLFSVHKIRFTSLGARSHLLSRTTFLHESRSKSRRCLHLVPKPFSHDGSSDMVECFGCESSLTTFPAIKGFVANTLSLTLVWSSIALQSYLFFYQGLKSQGLSRDNLHYKAPYQPYLSYFGLAMLSLIILMCGFDIFLHGNW